MVRRDNILLVALLYPFSLIYGFVVSIRNILFDYHILVSHEFDIPVISVGNITAGGTGKTPHIEHLARLLRTEFRVAILSRGYRRKSGGYQLVTGTSTAGQVGDEPLQLKKKFPDVIVAVENSRVKGIKRLMAEYQDLSVILLDDAFQHRYVRPGLSILLVDYNQPLSADRLLPAGRLREQPFEKRRAHLILVTRCPEHLKPIERRLVVKDLQLFPFQHLFFTTIKYEEPRPVFPDAVPDPLTHDLIRSLKPNLLMVAGIAYPRPLKKYLRSISTRIDEIIYPDHHPYRQKDIEFISRKFYSLNTGEKFLFTTEKDAMRLQKYAHMDPAIKARAYYVPLVIDFLNEDTRNFNQLILNYVRNNRRNSILHKKQD